MGRASKLLNKTKKLESKVRKQHNRIHRLEAHSEVSDVTFKPVTEEIVEEFIDDNEELIEALRVLEEQEEEIEGFVTKALNIQRVDYSFPDEKDYGIEVQLPVGVITASGVRSGDEICFLTGSLEGRSLEILEVLNSVTLRLDDVTTYGSQESDIKVKFTID